MNVPTPVVAFESFPYCSSSIVLRIHLLRQAAKVSLAVDFPRRSCLSCALLLFPSVGRPPPLDDHLLSPQDLISCLDDGGALRSKTSCNCTPTSLSRFQNCPPGALERCGCSRASRCCKQSRAKECESGQSGVTVQKT